VASLLYLVEEIGENYFGVQTIITCALENTPIKNTVVIKGKWANIPVDP
jgi:hypothetical protein